MFSSFPSPLSSLLPLPPPFPFLLGSLLDLLLSCLLLRLGGGRPVVAVAAIFLCLLNLLNLLNLLHLLHLLHCLCLHLLVLRPCHHC